MNDWMITIPMFFGILVALFLGIVILLLPAIIAAIFFEWGFSRWKRVRFNKHRYLTIVILCIAVRLLLPTTYTEKLGTRFREVVDVVSGYHYTSQIKHFNLSNGRW